MARQNQKVQLRYYRLEYFDTQHEPQHTQRVKLVVVRACARLVGNVCSVSMKYLIDFALCHHYGAVIRT